MGTLNKEEIKNPILLNIIALCESSSRKVTPSKMCTDLELSRSLTTKLKNDPERSISGETALKIADYFGVSVDQVLGSEQKEKSPAPEGVGLTETQQKAWNLIQQMDEESLKKFIVIAKTVKGDL